MIQTQTPEVHVELSVENVGGIDSTEIAFSPRVTSLTGRNATNQMLVLQASTVHETRIPARRDVERGL